MVRRMGGRLLVLALLLVEASVAQVAAVPDALRAAATAEAAALAAAERDIQALRRYRDALATWTRDRSGAEALVAAAIDAGLGEVMDERAQLQADLDHKVRELQALRDSLQSVLLSPTAGDAVNVTQVGLESAELAREIQADRDAMEAFGLDDRIAAVRAHYATARAADYARAHDASYTAILATRDYLRTARALEHAEHRAGLSESEYEGTYDAAEGRSQTMESVAEALRDTVMDDVNEELRQADRILEVRVRELRAAWTMSEGTPGLQVPPAALPTRHPAGYDTIYQ